MPNENEASELRAICPYCDSLTQSGRQDPKFYVNTATGLYYCFHCGIKGKDLSDDLLERLNVIDEIAKKPFDKTKLASLEASGPELDLFIKERFGNPSNDSGGEAMSFKGKSLYFSPEYKAIAIINRDMSGEPIGIKYRKIDPTANPRYLSETGSVHEGFWLKGEDNTKLLILEGELDALTASLCGFKGDILACQTNRIPESQLKAIRAHQNVFVLPDNDLGGEQLKISSNGLLGALKPIIISLPQGIAKDLNEYLQRSGYEQCSQFIRMETRTQLERDTRGLTESIPELLTWLSDDRRTSGDSTGWKSIDSALGGGLRAGEMSIINAFAKAGKSSFITNLIHNLARNGKKIALASFEMPPHSTYTSLISIALQANIRQLNQQDRDDLVNHSVEEFAYLKNITMLQRFGYTPWEDIEQWAIMMKRLYDIDYLVLDHAGFMVEKMTDAEENQILAKNIKKLTNTLGIHIPVVVQAPKTKDGLSIQTSYGGMAWGQNADNFLILDRDKSNESLLKVRLEAARYPNAKPSYEAIHLFYNRETLTLTE